MDEMLEHVKLYYIVALFVLNTALIVISLISSLPCIAFGNHSSFQYLFICISLTLFICTELCFCSELFQYHDSRSEYHYLSVFAIM